MRKGPSARARLPPATWSFSWPWCWRKLAATCGPLDIHDPQPETSLIRYAVEQGHRVFVVSWRNPDESLREATWDAYIENAAIKAIHTVQEISGSEQTNA